MKVISKSDLMILISLIGDRDSFDIDDFEKILDRFGDDYFICDGEFKKTRENKEMAEIVQKIRRVKNENISGHA